jgi:uncharacterized protein (TIGR02145 family)
MSISKAMLVTVATIYLIGVSCDNQDPVSNNNNNKDTLSDTNNVTKGTVTDVDENVYQTVKIGDQTWTMEDLRTTKYNDGSKIPLVTDNVEWSTLTTSAFCYYKNITHADSIKKYGALYNWYAVNTNKLAPAGWHVPSQSEWQQLKNYLIANRYNYDETTTGNKVGKSLAAKSDWLTSTNPGAVGNNLSTNNKSSFSALPGGPRFSNGTFGDRSRLNHWWSATAVPPPNNDGKPTAYNTFLKFDRDSVCTDFANMKNCGFSVRLVKNK